MSDIKVSEMPAAQNVNDEDIMMIVQNNINKTIPISAILDIIDEKVSESMELAFPIGSTYITQTNTNPNSILGFGTWERLKGKVCLGLDENDTDLSTIGNIGGEKEHTLTVAELAKHTHYGLYWYGIHPISLDGGGSEIYMSTSSSGNANTTNALSTGETGGNQPHNNMQPYEVVGYMWIRRS